MKDIEGRGPDFNLKHNGTTKNFFLSREHFGSDRNSCRHQESKKATTSFKTEENDPHYIWKKGEKHSKTLKWMCLKPVEG